MIRHLFLAVALVGLALAGAVQYDAHEERRWPYPTEAQLHEDYERYVGEEVLLFGTVQSVDPTGKTAVVEVEGDAEAFSIRIRRVDADVERGGTVQVLGRLESARTMTASRVVVVERSPGDRLRKVALSVVGGALALAAFFRYWRIDWSTMTFAPR